jgi:DNA mismatch repair protein MutS
VHLDATEHDGQLVFLHAVKPGPANQSYGLQVAALAGVPKDVIRRAKAYLGSLESMQAAHVQSPQASLPLGPLPKQAEPESNDEPDALREALDRVDPDNMSPREALEALYELKQLD